MAKPDPEKILKQNKSGDAGITAFSKTERTEREVDLTEVKKKSVLIRVSMGSLIALGSLLVGAAYAYFYLYHVVNNNIKDTLENTEELKDSYNEYKTNQELRIDSIEKEIIRMDERIKYLEDKK